METIPGSSYGELYGGDAYDFDFIEFVKRPTTLYRLISTLFAIVVFGCISAAGFDAFDQCIYNRNDNACNYGIVIGVLAFLGCLFFVAVDVKFRGIRNPATRRHLVTADLGFSGVWAFLWFVGFCFLADQWRKTSIKTSYQNNHARAAIAFSFFSIFSWVALTFTSIQRYRQGGGFQQDDGLPSRTNEFQGGFGSGASYFDHSPYASFPHPSEEKSIPPYQQQQQQQQQPHPIAPPFGVPPQTPVITEYRVPEY